MTARYALRFETEDGTLEDAYTHVSEKRLALTCARRAAKQMTCLDVVRVWVDDTKTGLGVQAFEVAR